MANAPIAVLGTGMAALGASRILRNSGARFVRYDKNGYEGGHARSIHYANGFVFDEGVHISFTRNEHVKQVFAENVQGAYEERDFTIDNIWQGIRVPQPVQCHLQWLPPEISVRVVRDFIAQRHAAIRAGFAEHIDRSTDAEISSCKTYADWLYAVYGKTFADTFPIAYGNKYHTVPMHQLNAEWVGPRMYRPSLDDLLLGMLGQPIANPHYVQRYRYPNHGGFVRFLTANDQFDTRLNHEVSEIDADGKWLRFSNGEIHPYATLISSIPLPELIAVIDDVPPSVVQASKQLAFTSVFLVNIGIDRANISTTDMTYFYDDDIIISRIHLPHRLSSNNAPEGCGSIQAEVYFSEKYRPLSISYDSLVDRVVNDLRRTGFIRPSDSILLSDAVVCRYANVIYDHNRSVALDTVRDFLDAKKIHCCGRYGDWNHAWTDEAFLSGEATARRALVSAT